MPDNSYTISSKLFKSGGLIEGYSPTQSDFEQLDTSNYTSESWDFYAMSAYAKLVVSADFTVDGANDTFKSFVNAISAKLFELERCISATVIDSDIYNFNNAPAGEKLPIQAVTYEVLSEAKAVYELTDGYYNPALYYNIQIYGFGGADYYPKTVEELPSDSIIQKYTELAKHFGEITLETVADEDSVTYYVTKPDYTVEVDGRELSLKVDLGGIGKGYAVDRIDELFDEYGYKYGYFNFGTSSMLVKSNVQNGEYNLGFSNPRSVERAPYLTTTIRNEKLSTSGDDEQYYIIDEVRYCHVISPVTGKPVQTGIMSATVIGGSAAEDDALTTAIMAMEKQDAIKFIREKLSDKRVVFTCE